MNVREDKNSAATNDRAIRHIKEWIQRMDLNLTGMNVLTEAATGNFAASPSVALMAGAQHVFAWARDSRHGSAEAGVKQVRGLLSSAGISEKRVTFACNQRPQEHVAASDLILNSGHVRPINRLLLNSARTKKTTVALMYDAWEFRDTDVDLGACSEAGIGLAGVNESDEQINIFKTCGQLALKMAFDAGYEVAFNRILVWSDDQFGRVVADAFRQAQANEVLTTTEVRILKQESGRLDFIFICDYCEEHEIIGTNGILPISALSLSGCMPGIVHLCGALDAKWGAAQGLNVYPLRRGMAKKMTFTLDELGPSVSIGLQVAGIRAAVACHRGEECSFSQKLA
jgi:hypothetical protein